MKTTTKLKILIFAHDASLYGASQSLLTLLDGIIQKKIADVFVLLPYGGKMEEVLKAKGIKYQVHPFPRCVAKIKSKNLFQKLKNIYLYKISVTKINSKLKNIVEEFKPNLIYTNTSVVSVGQKLANKYRLPHVWHIREFGDLDYNFEYLPSRKKVVATTKLANKLIFVSNKLKEHWGSEKNKNAFVIYNGLVKNSSNYPDRNHPLTNFRFGILGAIMHGKGQATAIEAIAKLSKKYNVSLAIFGNVVDKIYNKQLLSLIEKLGCKEIIHFKTFENNQNLIYENIDVLLNCSAMEGFGRTLVEAMERGIPVIANASGGPLEIIQHKENGLLYNNTHESLYEKMCELIDNKILYEQISKNGKKDAKNKYSEETYLNSVLNIFESVLNK